MGNFLEDWLFGVPNQQTGETDGGLAAVADTLWPFEGTAVSNVWDHSALGVMLTPKVPQLTAAAGLTALEAMFSYGLYRPASTLLQAGAAGGVERNGTTSALNPLYRDGVQFQDFIDMWNASEYITPARALTQWSWYQSGYGDMPIRNPRIDSSALAMIKALNNPYPTAGGLSREQYEEAWDESALATVVSGSLDATLGLIGIPGAGAVLGKAKTAAGLQATIRNSRDLAAMRNGIDEHAKWVASQGAEGKWNVSGKHVQDLAEETDVSRIIRNPLLDNSSRSGSFNRDRLTDIIAATDDPATVAELVLADRGDTLALGRLFQAAPDHIWSLTDMNERLAAQFARGGQYFPAKDTARVIRTTFDSAIERDEWWTAVRDTFMQGQIDDGMALIDDVVEETVTVAGGRTIPATSSRAQEITALEAELSRVSRESERLFAKNGLSDEVTALDKKASELRKEIDRLKSEAPRRDEIILETEKPVYEPGKLNAVKGEGSDFMPLGTVGSTPAKNVTGMAQAWLRRLMSDAMINRPNTYAEIPLGPTGPKPVTKLLFWASGRQPLNMVAYNQLRPTEVVDEMLAYSRSSRSLRKGTWTVSRKDPKTGEPLRVELQDWQWRAQAIERIVKAKATGDVALDKVIDDLQRELISVITNRYALTGRDADRAAEAINDWLGVAQEQVARDGFFFDDAASRVIVDPKVARQLPTSRILMPLDDLDWFLRNISETTYATRGRGTRRVVRFVESGLDTFFKLFRTNVLFKPGYVPKNSFAEPAVSSILADGSLIADGGLAKTLRRFDINNDRRLLKARYGVVDRLPGSAAKRDARKANEIANEYASLTEQLDEIDQHIADLAEASPATQSKYLEAALVERRTLNKQLAAAERELSIADPAWSEVVEVPTYSELSDRVAAIRTALTSDEFPAVAQARIDELLAMGAERTGVLGNRVALTKKIEELQARRAQLVKTRDELAPRAGRRAVERDLKDPAKNKRQDLLDPESPDARTAPDPIESEARSLDTVYDYKLKKFVKRDVSSNSRKPGRDASNRRAEAMARSIAYIDDQITALQAAIRAGDRTKPFGADGLTAVETSEVQQLRALIAAREAADPATTQKLIDNLSRQLDEIRQQTFVVDPGAKAKAEALRARLAELDQQSRTLNGRIAKRRIVRENLSRRELSGEDDIILDVGGVRHTIPGPFSTEKNFGAALRAEASADLSQAQQVTGGVQPLGISASRGLGARYSRTGAGEQVFPTDTRYWDELAYSYNRHVLNDDFAKMILAGKSDAEIFKWFGTKTGQRYAKAMGWSRDDLRGGPSGSVKARPLGVESTTDARIMVFDEGIIAETRRLINQQFPDPAVRTRLLKGEEMTAGELQAAMGAREDLAPLYGTGLRLIGNPWAKANAAINNALDAIWRNLASKPESRFARWPYMTREYKRQMERSIALRQDQGLVVTGTDIAAMRNQAYARALKETENSFYNIRRMANPVFALRYLTAFASAAWNTLYRYGRLSYRAPGTAMVVAWAWQNSLTTVGIDKDGDKVERWQDADNIIINLPDWMDLPIDPNLKMSTETFNFATQESGFSPTISVAAGTVLRHKPELDTWLKENHPELHEELFGYGTNTNPKIDVLGIPLDPGFSSYQRKGLTLVKTFLGMDDEDFIKSAELDYNYQLFQWSREGQVGPMPTFEDSAKNARDFYLASVGISAVTSGVSGINQEGNFYREELFAIREKHPDDYLAYQAEAYSTLGPEAWFLMQSTSSSRSAMPPTSDALGILRDNEALATDLLEMSTTDPKLTVDLLFLDEMTYTEDEFSQAVYDWSFRNSLPGDNEPIRERDDETDIKRELAKAQSWAVWNASIANRDAILLQLGEKTMRETGPTAALYAQWHAFEDAFVNDPQNSLMVEELGLINTGKTAIALKALNTMTSNREWMRTSGTSPTWKAIDRYLTALNTATSQYEALETTTDRRAFAAQWDAYVRDTYLPGAGNFAGYYERRLAGRDLTGGRQMLDRTLNIPGFPLPETS